MTTWNGVIPEQALKSIEKVIATQNARGTKINATAGTGGMHIPPIRLHAEPIVVPEEDGSVSTMMRLTLDAPQIEFGTWRFVATLEHHRTADGWKNVVAHLPGCEDIVPDMYKVAPPSCEQCNTQRERSDTFLALHLLTGEWRQVGRSCLAEMTGVPQVAAALTYLSNYATVVQRGIDKAIAKADATAASTPTWLPKGSHVDTWTYLCHVAAAMRMCGWYGARDAQNGQTPTYQTACRTLRTDPDVVTDDDRDLAVSALVWSRTGLQPISDFEWNMHAACAGEYVQVRHAAVAAHAIRHYVAAWEAQQLLTHHIDNVETDEPVTIQAVVKHVAANGNPNCYLFVDDAGRHIFFQPDTPNAFVLHQRYELSGIAHPQLGDRAAITMQGNATVRVIPTIVKRTNVPAHCG